jgi:uridylate kinase
MDNKLSIIVFNLWTPGNLEKAVLGEPVGTMISG